MFKHGVKATKGFFEGGISLGIRSTAKDMAKNTRVAKAVSSNRGKVIGAAIGVGVVGGSMRRSGRAADRPTGRPTGPYMY
jgi:hypothetical protein